jgi:hypothetical protein
MKASHIASPMIQAIVRDATASGNAVAEISEGWTRMKQVIYMRDPLTSTLRMRLSADSSLHYCLVEPSPHNRAEECFTDEAESVSISFPRPDSL